LLLAWAFFLTATLFFAIWIAATIGAINVEPTRQLALPVGIVSAVTLGTLELLIRSQAMWARHARWRTFVWYGSTVLEVGVITVSWFIGARLISPPNILFPGVVGFSALTVLSALRLDWRIAAFTGVLSAIASATLHLLLQEVPLPVGARPGLVGNVNLLLTSGAVAALVAEQARRRTLDAIGAIVARQRLEREVMEAADAERQRVGRDLHDGLGSRLWGLALHTEGLARRAENGQSVTVDELRELAGLVGEGVDEVRRLARGLDPAPVETGLVPALRGLAERTESAGTDCTFVAEGDEAKVARATTLNLYHIAHEAVANAIRHGSAGKIDIRLTARASTIALDVKDDGTGILDDHAEGLGLRTMRQRAALLDAVLLVRRGPTGGTVVSCVVPIGT
jgi:signal transduction histidine kinase